MKLNNIRTLTAQLELVTGLHIGTGDADMKIGGIDSSVTKHPITGLPYIPGSSIKGKMRAMMELRAGVVSQTAGDPLSYKVWQGINDQFGREEGAKILKLFGLGGSDKLDAGEAQAIGPTRLAFWDCTLNSAWLQEVGDRFVTEEKSENAIDRIRGVAKHPRFIERVPSGARFDFRVTIKQFENDGDELLETLLAGLKLLELDGIGGSGSRGYGKIRFAELALDDGALLEQFAVVEPF